MLLSLVLCAPGQSTRTARSSQCMFLNTPQAAGYIDCYIAGQYHSMVNMWNDDILYASPHANDTITLFSMDGWTTATFHDMNEIDICRMCTVTPVTRSRKLCLACEKTSSTETAHQASKHHIVFSQSNIEIKSGQEYYACYFDIHETLARLEPVKSKDDCIPNITTNTTKVCDKSLKYIISETMTFNRTIAIRAKAQTDDMCRMCMIRTSEKHITMGRACVDPSPITAARHKQISLVHMVMFGTSTLGILGLCLPPLLSRTEPLEDLFKKILRVGIMLLQLTVFGILYAITDCEVVHVLVPDSGDPETIRPHNVLLTGLKLCFNANILQKTERNDILER